MPVLKRSIEVGGQEAKGSSVRRRRCGDGSTKVEYQRGGSRREWERGVRRKRVEELGEGRFIYPSSLA